MGSGRILSKRRSTFSFATLHLRQIFRTGIYQRFQDEIKQEASRIDEERKQQQRNILLYLGSMEWDGADLLAEEAAKAGKGEMLVKDVLPLLDRLIEQDRETDARNGEEMARLEKRIENLSARLAQAEEQDRTRRELNQARMDLERMLRRWNLSARRMKKQKPVFRKRKPGFAKQTGSKRSFRLLSRPKK